MWPPCPRACQGWRGARHLTGGCGTGGGGRSRMAEGSPALPPWWAGEGWHGDTAPPDTGCPKRFWANCCRRCLRAPRKRRAETFSRAGSGGRAAAVDGGSPGRAQPSGRAPFRCSRQRRSLFCKPRVMFHLLLGAAVVCYLVLNACCPFQQGYNFS